MSLPEQPDALRFSRPSSSIASGEFAICCGEARLRSGETGGEMAPGSATTTDGAPPQLDARATRATPLAARARAERIADAALATPL